MDWSNILLFYRLFFFDWFAISPSSWKVTFSQYMYSEIIYSVPVTYIIVLKNSAPAIFASWNLLKLIIKRQSPCNQARSSEIVTICKSVFNYNVTWRTRLLKIHGAARFVIVGNSREHAQIVHVINPRERNENVEFERISRIGVKLKSPRCLSYPREWSWQRPGNQVGFCVKGNGTVLGIGDFSWHYCRVSNARGKQKKSSS